MASKQDVELVELVVPQNMRDEEKAENRPTEESILCWEASDRETSCYGSDVEVYLNSMSRK